MDAQRGASLLSTLWPEVDVALSEEHRADRLRFISDFLQCFARNGVELSNVLSLDEDIRSCAEHLGTHSPKQRTDFELDTRGFGNPADYELIGGPFDGSVFRLGAGLEEMPPGLVTLTADQQPTRMDGETTYELSQITERDSNGEPIGEYIAYKHKQQNAK